jgi:hypothetical protein
MLDVQSILSEINALDPAQSFEISRSLASKARDQAQERAADLIKSLLPSAAELNVNGDHEYDDNGGTYFSMYGLDLLLQDGRTLELPTESNLDSGDWADGSCGPEVEEDELEELGEANPDLDENDLRLLALGEPFGLNHEAVGQLVAACSYLANTTRGEGWIFCEREELVAARKNLQTLTLATFDAAMAPPSGEATTTDGNIVKVVDVATEEGTP